jgi:hypothetical protein
MPSRKHHPADDKKSSKKVSYLFVSIRLPFDFLNGEEDVGVEEKEKEGDGKEEDWVERRGVEEDVEYRIC